jgi:hypothetical protein
LSVHIESDYNRLNKPKTGLGPALVSKQCLFTNQRACRRLLQVPLGLVLVLQERHRHHQEYRPQLVPVALVLERPGVDRFVELVDPSSVPFLLPTNKTSITT